MTLKWISESVGLPRIAQSVLLASPRQSGEFWDLRVASLLVRHEDVVPKPVKAGDPWARYYYWKVDHFGEHNVFLTGNNWWALMNCINLPPGAEHDFDGMYHYIRAIKKGPTNDA